MGFARSVMVSVKQWQNFERHAAWCQRLLRSDSHTANCKTSTVGPTNHSFPVPVMCFSSLLFQRVDASLVTATNVIKSLLLMLTVVSLSRNSRGGGTTSSRETLQFITQIGFAIAQNTVFYVFYTMSLYLWYFYKSVESRKKNIYLSE